MTVDPSKNLVCISMSGPDQITIDPDWFAGNIILAGPWSEFKCSGPWSEIFVDNFRPVSLTGLGPNFLKN